VGRLQETRRKGRHWECLILMCGDDGVLALSVATDDKNKEHMNSSTSFGAVLLELTGAKMGYVCA
jgi:hypothetical protein